MCIRQHRKVEGELPDAKFTAQALLCVVTLVINLNCMTGAHSVALRSDAAGVHFLV